MQKQDSGKIGEISVKLVKIQAELIGMADVLKLIQRQLPENNDDLRIAASKFEEIIDNLWAIRGRLNNLRR